MAQPHSRRLGACRMQGLAAKSVQPLHLPRAGAAASGSAEREASLALNLLSYLRDSPTCNEDSRRRRERVEHDPVHAMWHAAGACCAAAAAATPPMTGRQEGCAARSSPICTCTPSCFPAPRASSRGDAGVLLAGRPGAAAGVLCNWRAWRLQAQVRGRVLRCGGAALVPLGGERSAPCGCLRTWVA